MTTAAEGASQMRTSPSSLGIARPNSERCLKGPPYGSTCSPPGFQWRLSGYITQDIVL